MSFTLRIGLIGDTHNRLHPRVAELFSEVDEIWHLGDVCTESILDELRATNPRLTVVLGNNDDLDYPLTRQLQRGGESFFLQHIPPRTWPVSTGWFLHGHTHVPRDERAGDLRIFNPGSAGLASKGAPLSLAFLTKEGDAPFRAEVVLL